jgi:hypothetical protein
MAEGVSGAKGGSPADHLVDLLFQCGGEASGEGVRLGVDPLQGQGEAQLQLVQVGLHQVAARPAGQQIAHQAPERPVDLLSLALEILGHEGNPPARLEPAPRFQLRRKPRSL